MDLSRQEKELVGELTAIMLKRMTPGGLTGTRAAMAGISAVAMIMATLPPMHRAEIARVVGSRLLDLAEQRAAELETV